MTYDALGPSALNYAPCRYGSSKQLFRGPQRNLEKPFIAFLGGSETYGKFIENPFPALVEDHIGVPCVNFGLMNAGLDSIVHDTFIPRAADAARVTVLQVLGAHSLSNRCFTVHPRRNDRFFAASELLKALYHDVDFSQFQHTRDMLRHLSSKSDHRFETVRQEMQQAWIGRMRNLLSNMQGKSILLWLADHAPNSTASRESSQIGSDPLFVTSEMMNEISPYATQIVQVVPDRASLASGTAGMVFDQLEEKAAREMLGVSAHEQAAMRLANMLK